jgi:RecB family endonuclease NucS
MVSDLGNVSLRKVSEGWEFSSELALEDFVWEHLEDLLQLKPFQRQYAVVGEVCDILALTVDHQLVILELKNTEDRYIIQQLTRYYANLIEEKPFLDRIDYGRGIRLIAIAPTFHRHNYIDRQYSRLTFEFIQVKVTRSDQFYLELHHEDADKELSAAPLPFQEIELDHPSTDLPEIPEQLIRWLGACSATDQQAILKVRQQILAFHPRMQEIVSKTSIQYGTGKTKLCAEVCFHRSRQQPILFLWLPLPNCLKSLNRPERVGRLRLWIADGIVTHVGHVPNGLGKMRLEAEWNALPKSKWPRKALMENLGSDSMTPVLAQRFYRSVIEPNHDDMQHGVQLNQLVSVALSKWLEKLSR